MSKMDEREFIRVIEALDTDEKILALKHLPSELIIDEFLNRFWGYAETINKYAELSKGGNHA